MGELPLICPPPHISPLLALGAHEKAGAVKRLLISLDQMKESSILGNSVAMGRQIISEPSHNATTRVIRGEKERERMPLCWG